MKLEQINKAREDFKNWKDTAFCGCETCAEDIYEIMRDHLPELLDMAETDLKNKKTNHKN